MAFLNRTGRTRAFHRRGQPPEQVRGTRQNGVVRFHGSLPFRGQLIWLTPDQGGRSSGPPPTPADQDYAATAFVPPDGMENGWASFVLRVDDRTAWRSPSTGGWLAIDNPAAPTVRVGTVLIITEGPRQVGYFHVTEVLDSGPTRNL